MINGNSLLVWGISTTLKYYIHLLDLARLSRLLLEVLLLILHTFPLFLSFFLFSSIRSLVLHIPAPPSECFSQCGSLSVWLSNGVYTLGPKTPFLAQNTAFFIHFGQRINREQNLSFSEETSWIELNLEWDSFEIRRLFESHFCLCTRFLTDCVSALVSEGDFVICTEGRGKVMDTYRRLVAGSHERNQLVFINADDAGRVCFFPCNFFQF